MHHQIMKLSVSCVFFMLCLLVLNPAGAASTKSPETFQIIDGVAIYLGVMPAQIVRGHRATQQEKRMHGGIPKGRNSVHLVVALFDSTSDLRIEDAQITASVSELGVGGETKKLDAMHIADNVTYGNYFDMVGDKTYRIQLSIRLPGRAQAIEANFSHRRFSP